MAYKKYIKRGGKIYGPYIYHSKRVDGKVVSEYHGSQTGKEKKINFLFIVLAAFVIVLLAYAFVNFSDSTTGFASLDIDSLGQEASLAQQASIFLNEGELMPKNSSVIFENQGNRYEYSLLEVMPENALLYNGSYFVHGKNLSGNGEGYGFPGKKQAYVEVSFILIVSDAVNSTNSSREVYGKASKEQEFFYTLNENEAAELKAGSVKDNFGNSLPEDTITLSVNNSNVIAETEHVGFEEGFGEEYFGSNASGIAFDLPSSLSLSPGVLNVSITYMHNGSVIEILRTSTLIEDKTNSTTAASEETGIVPKSNVEESLAIESVELTDEEIFALESHFGNSSLVITEAVKKNGFLVVKYEIENFGQYWVEYSYPELLSNATLERFMEEDRAKWLKDLAQSFMESKGQEEDAGLQENSFEF